MNEVSIAPILDAVASPQRADSAAQRTPRRSRRSGGSIIEMTLLVPWYVFLFVGVFDWGYYAHALISTEAAARAAVLYTSKNSVTANDQATACIYALNELKVAENVPNTS